MFIRFKFWNADHSEFEIVKEYSAIPPKDTVVWNCGKTYKVDCFGMDLSADSNPYYEFSVHCKEVVR